MCRKVESSLHEQLTDHLNAEIVAKTIRRCGVVGGGKGVLMVAPYPQGSIGPNNQVYGFGIIM